MKKLFFSSLVLVLLIVTLPGKAQMNNAPKKDVYRTNQFYFSQEGEMIFSFANIESNVDTLDIENIMRWSPVFNFTGHLNYDVSKNIGFDLGLGIRNVGFIAKFQNQPNNLKKKFRTYNLGLPIGIKIGSLEQKHPFFVFGGYEIEMPFSYKEKTFHGGDKDGKITGWFSDRTERFTQSVYAGIQFPQGFSLKFKYYLDNFLNQDFTETKNGVTYKPYAGFDANVFYFSINWYPFQDTKLYDFDFSEQHSSGTVTSANW